MAKHLVVSVQIPDSQLLWLFNDSVVAQSLTLSSKLLSNSFHLKLVSSNSFQYHRKSLHHDVSHSYIARITVPLYI